MKLSHRVSHKSQASLAHRKGCSRECEGDDGEQEEEAQRDAQPCHDPLCRGAIDLHATSQIDDPDRQPYSNAGAQVLVPSRQDVFLA